ncbi:hypothetical protein CLOSTMETH_02559 [[Clostridium] methylpentosum DSM 5476]|uniref:Uncharacterized protein n=1 Tax=[Clostridium] methylpentosum DSM 5476 TaxID=537013 RepID=C0EFB8_9FIRM|nr:hypothetical protein CLOSTMETH_02559 [[Clostridium] methylpentosum DSM 5476]
MCAIIKITVRRSHIVNALQNFGQGNAKTADKFWMTCLPFEAVIRLYGSSILFAKQKQPFYIYEYAS